MVKMQLTDITPHTQELIAVLGDTVEVLSLSIDPITKKLNVLLCPAVP